MLFYVKSALQSRLNQISKHSQNKLIFIQAKLIIYNRNFEKSLVIILYKDNISFNLLTLLQKL